MKSGRSHVPILTSVFMTLNELSHFPQTCSFSNKIEVNCTSENSSLSNVYYFRVFDVL